MKKFLLSIMMMATISAPAVLTSCGSDDPKPEPPVTESELKGSITTTQTLDAAITYTITGPVIVEDGGVLNIPAGTMIKAKKMDSAIIFSYCKVEKSMRGVLPKNPLP